MVLPVHMFQITIGGGIVHMHPRGQDFADDNYTIYEAKGMAASLFSFILTQ